MAQILLGLAISVAGGLLFYGGLKESESSVGGLKYRKLMIGGFAVIMGIILMLR